MWGTFLLGIKEALVLVALYISLLLFSNKHKDKRKNLKLENLLKFAIVYALLVTVLHRLESPLYNALLSYTGVLLGSKLIDIM